MQSFIDNDRGFIRLDKDQDLFTSLLEICQENKWHSAHFSGIGALKDVELGYYHLNKKEYDRRTFPKEAELLSLEGNLSLKDGDPFLHLHAVLGNENFQCYGGHLFAAKIAVTCEINARAFNAKVVREMNETIGLPHVTFCPITE